MSPVECLSNTAFSSRKYFLSLRTACETTFIVSFQVFPSLLPWVSLWRLCIWNQILVDDLNQKRGVEIERPDSIGAPAGPDGVRECRVVSVSSEARVQRKWAQTHVTAGRLPRQSALLSLSPFHSLSLLGVAATASPDWELVCVWACVPVSTVVSDAWWAHFLRCYIFNIYSRISYFQMLTLCIPL